MSLTVTLLGPAGPLVGLRADDGSHVLAEQVDAAWLTIGQRLEGSIGSIGVHTLADPSSAARHASFVIAFGLSLDALRCEFE